MLCLIVSAYLFFATLAWMGVEGCQPAFAVCVAAIVAGSLLQGLTRASRKQIATRYFHLVGVSNPRHMQFPFVRPPKIAIALPAYQRGDQIWPETHYLASNDDSAIKIRSHDEPVGISLLYEPRLPIEADERLSISRHNERWGELHLPNFRHLHFKTYPSDSRDAIRRAAFIQAVSFVFLFIKTYSPIYGFTPYPCLLTGGPWRPSVNIFGHCSGLFGGFYGTNAIFF
jgi:hypothetical protein